MKQWLKREWKFVLLLVVVAVGFMYYEFDKPKSVPMGAIAHLSDIEVLKAANNLNIPITQAESRYITKEIIKREQLPPDIVYITITQQEADAKANKIAKQDQADFVLKNKTDDNGTITNKYFGIHMDKQHEIKVGVTNIDNKTYLSTGYQYKNIDIVLHSKDLKKIDGGSLMITVTRF